MTSQEKRAPLRFPDRVKIARFIEERVEILKDAAEPADRTLRYKDGLTDAKIADLYGLPGLTANQVMFIRSTVVGKMPRGGPRPPSPRANLTQQIAALTETIAAQQALMEKLESDLATTNERCRVIAERVIELYRRLDEKNADLMLPNPSGWTRWAACHLPINGLPDRLRR